MPAISLLTGAVGKASDGRLLIVAWITESGPCGVGQPKGFGACARSVASLIREIVFDHATDQLISRPVADYDAMHNATFVQGKRMVLAAGATPTALPVPAAAGGALDVAVSFDLSTLTAAASGFGVAVRAPTSGMEGAVGLSLSVSAPDSAGTRVVTPSQGVGAAPAPESRGTKVLAYMNASLAPRPYEYWLSRAEV